MPRPQFNFGIEVCPLIKHGQLPLQDTDNNLSRTQTVYTIAQCHKPLQDSDTVQNCLKLSGIIHLFMYKKIAVLIIKKAIFWDSFTKTAFVYKYV